ncbi:MAG: hypothetical protein ABL993_07120 [Vicinamibacterales bacterium]
MEQRWTRWHSDGWVLTVVRTPDGEFFYASQQEQAVEAPMTPALSLPDAQHKAEDIVRNSGHRCVARCSFWIPSQPNAE